MLHRGLQDFLPQIEICNGGGSTQRLPLTWYEAHASVGTHAVIHGEPTSGSGGLLSEWGPVGHVLMPGENCVLAVGSFREDLIVVDRHLPALQLVRDALAAALEQVSLYSTKPRMLSA